MSRYRFFRIGRWAPPYGVDRYVERDHEPPDYIEAFESLADMRLACMAPDGSDDAFRAALMSIADDFAAVERSLDELKSGLPDADFF